MAPTTYSNTIFSCLLCIRCVGAWQSRWKTRHWFIRCKFAPLSCAQKYARLLNWNRKRTKRRKAILADIARENNNSMKYSKTHTGRNEKMRRCNETAAWHQKKSHTSPHSVPIDGLAVRQCLISLCHFDEQQKNHRIRCPFQIHHNVSVTCARKPLVVIHQCHRIGSVKRFHQNRFQSEHFSPAKKWLDSLFLSSAL